VGRRTAAFVGGASVELRHVMHATEVAGYFHIVHDHTMLGLLCA
jgi:hypothetical protein